LQNIDNVFHIKWNENTYYADVHFESEYQFSKYNFEVANTNLLFSLFEMISSECKRALGANLPLPAYDQCMLASHIFNTLDARKAISVTQRAEYILKIRELSKGCALLYKSQEEDKEARLMNAKEGI
jgi:glycyl-tRNA synthetase alpha chain